MTNIFFIFLRENKKLQMIAINIKIQSGKKNVYINDVEKDTADMKKIKFLFTSETFFFHF